MPTVPRVETPNLAVRGLPTSTGIATPNANAFGAGLGRAVQGAGAQLSQYTLQRQASYNESSVKEADAALSSRIQSLQNEYLNLRGKNALEGTEPYKASVQAARDEVMESLPNSRARSMFQPHADSTQLSALSNGTRHNQTQLRQYETDASKARTASAIQGIAQGATKEEVQLYKRNLAAEVEGQAQVNGWSPEQTEQVMLQALTSAHKERISQLTESGNMQSLVAARVYFEDNKGEIDPTIWDNIENGFKGIEKQKRDLAASDLEIAVYDPDKPVTRAEIDNAYAGQLITASKRTQLYKAIIQQEAQLQRSTMLQETLIDTDAPLDYTQKDHKQAVEGAFQRELSFGQQRSEPTAETYERSAVRISANTGVLPKQVRTNLIGYANAGTPEQTTYGAKIVRRLQEEAPYTLNQMPAKERAVLTEVGDLVAAGVDQEAAVERVREKYSKPKAELAVITENYKRDTFDDEPNRDYLEGALESEHNRWYAPDPDIDLPPGMQADFEAMVKSNYSLNGNDLESARTTAFKDLGTQWAPDFINGGREMMRFPPIREYGHMSAEEQRGDLMLAIQTESADLPEDIDPTTFRVFSDDVTANALPGKRDYSVYYIGENNIPEIVRDAGGQPLRWRPNKLRVLEFQRAEGIGEFEENRQENIERRKSARHFTESLKGLPERI